MALQPVHPEASSSEQLSHQFLIVQLHNSRYHSTIRKKQNHQLYTTLTSVVGTVSPNHNRPSLSHPLMFAGGGTTKVDVAETTTTTLFHN